MKRTTISLPDALAGALEREAHRQRISLSEAARRAIEIGLGRTSERRVLPFRALGRSGHRTTARDVDSLLAVEWADDRDR
jgi:hypothetical protein